MVVISLIVVMVKKSNSKNKVKKIFEMIQYHLNLSVRL